MSRPKKEVTRSEVVRIKMTEEEKEALRKRAESYGMSMSEYMREAFTFTITHSAYYKGGKNA